MSRGERRRSEREERKRSPLQDDTGPLIDFIVEHSASVSLADLKACIDSLPVLRSTVTVCTTADNMIEFDVPGWRRPVQAKTPLAAKDHAARRQRAPFIGFVDAAGQLQDASSVDLALAHLASGAGVVGGLITAGGQVYAAGYVFPLSGRVYRRYKGWSPENKRVQLGRKDIQAVTFDFLITRRDLYYRPGGGFRPQFEGRRFADADYCVRARHHGAPIVYEPAIRVETSAAEYGPDPASAQLLVAGAKPVYDEWAVL